MWRENFGITRPCIRYRRGRRCASDYRSSGHGKKTARSQGRCNTIFRRYTDIIEPLSLDEAYLDVSGCKEFGGDAVRIAEAIRAAVRVEIGITISAGIAPNKLLAKIASDWNKPDGQFVVDADQVAGFIAQLPVSRLHGVGKVTSTRLRRLGIKTCGEMQRLSLRTTRTIGKFGERLYEQLPRHRQSRVEVSRTANRSAWKRLIRGSADLAAVLAELPGLVEQLERPTERMSHSRNRQAGRKIKFGISARPR